MKQEILEVKIENIWPSLKLYPVKWATIRVPSWGFCSILPGGAPFFRPFYLMGSRKTCQGAGTIRPWGDRGGWAGGKQRAAGGSHSFALLGSRNVVIHAFSAMIIHGIKPARCS
jgi:hypothetical protein